MIITILKNVLIIGILIIMFGMPSWVQWLGVLVLIPLLYLYETGGFVTAGDDNDPSGNDNINRKFTDYM